MGPKKGEKEKNQHIQVVVRCRPLNGIEKKQGCHNAVEANADRKEVHVKERPTPTAPLKSFTFDRVFGPKAKQIEIYKTTVVPIVEEVLLGYNCTIFAYGQTGTGKTFTMEGERTDDPSVSWEDDPLSGIIPRSMSQIFQRLDTMDCEYTVQVSYLEIYNEELIDLLGAESVDNPRLKIYEDVTKKGSCVIQGLEDVKVLNRDAVYDIMERGAQRRQTAATLMNAHSSRSHSVFMVTIHMKENSLDGEELLKTGKLNLVDLAGSECIGRSGAVDKRAREAGNINQSLLTLGRVITALVEHRPHVPYRESKLTRLLQDSLGGRTKTSIIATISPSSSSLEETLSTLEYAHRAKNITNRPEINQKLTKKALLKEYTEEMERLRRDLQAARDKNGFYIAEDNYNSMQTQILQQRDVIKDLEERIDILNSEMYKLNELFTDTQRELEDTTKELEVTSKNLEVTSDTLVKTRGTLCKTRQDRDEQKHLVLQHVKSETKLYEQASQLLYTADASTSHVEGLHAKLDRKRNVEDHNETTQQSFQRHFSENIDQMEARLSSFTQNQTSAIKGLKDDMGHVVSRRAEETQLISKDLEVVTQLITGQLSSLIKSQNQQRDKTGDWTQTVNKHFDEAQTTELNRQGEFEKLFLTSILSLQAKLSQITADLNSFSQTLEQQMTEQQSRVHLFLEKQRSSLDEQRSLVADYATEHAEAIEKHTQQMIAMETSHTQQNKVLLEEFLKGMQQQIQQHATKMIVQQETGLNSHIQTMTESLDVTKAKTMKFSKNLGSNLCETSSDMQLEDEGLLEQSKQHNEVSQNTISQITTSVASVESERQTLEATVTDFSAQSQQVFKTTTKEIKSMVEQHNADVSKWTQSQTTNQQALADNSTSQLNDVGRKQVSQNEQLKADIESQQSLLNQQSKTVCDWSQSHKSDLEERDEDVAKFLKEELRKDVVTGNTPQRCDYSYPRSLKRTDRHSLILKDFRQTYLLEDAMELPIPDNSLTNSEVSAVDIPKLSFDQLEGGRDSPVSSDPEDNSALSEDSAISTTSLISSTSNSKIRRAESKENMGPPSSMPRKTRLNSKPTTVTNMKNKSSSKPNTPNRDRSKTPVRGNSSLNSSKGNTPVHSRSSSQSRLPLRSTNNS